ncbi:hypothetical protein [Bradyrhizobium manausense]|uniref:Uncharacterized protein n=1 Tax=Bradyrhizobium manausense TaxID=989370 RepID=A0A0R3CZP5_9BRAD|nr:hypothetical protein [Bradyrhizobium manausense]KRQ03088.1 hypothetical protein AOQ71_30455 [Bradyrhizobium manausense]
MTIRVNSPAAWRGRLVKVASIDGSDAEIVWIGRDGDVETRDVWVGDLVSFGDAMSTQSNWGAAAEEESKIRSWRAAD